MERASAQALARIEALVQELCGTDPARCGEAHAELLALGGFSRPEIRDALDRATSGTVLRVPPPSRPSRALPGTRPPRVFGTFELGACLGRGGFGLVYRARSLDEAGEQNLCLKLANAGRAGSRAITRLFGRGPVTSEGVGFERVCADALVAQADQLRCGSTSPEDATLILQTEYAWLREIDSDLFPEVVAAGLADGRAYYVMEQLRGRDLRETLREGGAPHEWKRLVRRLARELASLQARRDDFFHGDLKPENIVVTRERLRLIDPAFRGGAQTPLVATLSVPYNPLGLAGERADTGALAITLLELVTGLQPFLARARVDLAQPLPLEAYADAASRDPLVRKLVRWVAEPPTYVELAAALER